MTTKELYEEIRRLQLFEIYISKVCIQRQRDENYKRWGFQNVLNCFVFHYFVRFQERLNCFKEIIRKLFDRFKMIEHCAFEKGWSEEAHVSVGRELPLNQYRAEGPEFDPWTRYTILSAVYYQYLQNAFIMVYVINTIFSGLYPTSVLVKIIRRK